MLEHNFFPLELDFPIPLSVTISKAFSCLSYRKGADGKFLFLEIFIDRLNCSLVGCLKYNIDQILRGKCEKSSS